LSDSSDPNKRESASGEDSPGGRDMEELRRLLFGAEIERLESLRERLENPERRSQDLVQVLPNAIHTSADQDEHFTKAIMPSVESALQTSVRKDARPIVDALFPIIGKLIRRSITETLRGMLNALNQSMEHTFSVQGLKWRLEAMRTGRSFPEVVLLHTLVFRVEQIFLIHKETGVLLQHMVAEDVAIQDGDMVSGMLSAIGDFVRDSFAVEEGEAVRSMQIGDLEVLVDDGPEAFVAAVVRGTPPQELKTTMQEALEDIHQGQRQAFADFEGDTTPFEASRSQLETCLLRKELEHKRKTPWMGLSVLGAALILLAVWITFSMKANNRWNDYLDQLHNEPGLVVTDSGKSGRTYFIRGLRDPLAADPDVILQQTDIPTDRVSLSWELYQAMEPKLIEKRARKRLRPDHSVKIRYSNGVLYAAGEARYDWIERSRLLATTVPGVETYDDTAVVDADLKALKAPATVNLQMERGRIVAKGRAPHLWIVQAREHVAQKSHLVGFHEIGLVDIDLDSLNPPSTVRLRVDGDTVYALGTAPYSWIRHARERIAGIKGFSTLDENGLTDLDLQALDAPTSVQLWAQGEVLYASGVAPHRWILLLQERVKKIEGLERLDMKQLVDQDHQAMRALEVRIEATDILFMKSTSRFLPNTESIRERLLRDVKELLKRVEEIGYTCHITVVGRTDSSGNEQRNMKLSHSRANRVLEEFKGAGFDVTAFREEALGAQQPRFPDTSEENRQRNRCVTLQVDISGISLPADKL
jgi:outer membrane protein OmpA-like peptidoglycan-associated protein